MKKNLHNISSAVGRIQCPACQAKILPRPQFVPDFEYNVAHSVNYHECDQCKSVFQDPMPSVEELGTYYPKTYHSQTNEGLLNKARNFVRFKRMLKVVGLRPGGCILDYGCGNGAFLVYAAQKIPGTQFFGYEIGAHREITQLAGGAVTIVRGSFSDLLTVLPKCALIMMNHVIEHLPDVSRTVSALSERLIPGGVFEGQTPAAGSLEHRVFGTFWSGYHSPRHTVVFSRVGLLMTLRRLSFGNVQVSSGFNPAGIAVSLAASTTGRSTHRVSRRGLSWFFWVGLAAFLAPIDLLSRNSGIIDFKAVKSSH